MKPFGSVKPLTFSTAAVLLMACASPETGALEPTSLDDDPIELLGEGTGASGLKTKSGKFKHDPVVFVHGCPLPDDIGSGTNYVTSTYWRPIYLELRGRGYPAADWPLAEGQTVDTSTIPTTQRRSDLASGGTSSVPSPEQYLNVFVYQGPPCGTSDEHATQLAAYVEQVRAATGSPKVDIVANSLGAVPARLYVKRGGARRVRDFVILAGANHGTNMGVVPTAPIPGSPFASDAGGGSGAYEGGRELFPAYACKGESPRDLQFELNGCLWPGRRVAVDETPDDVYEGGTIAYLNIYNVAQDELINPTFAACLNQKQPGDCTDFRVNLPIQVAVQSAEDAASGAPDTPHGSIRADEQAICPTVTFVMCRNKVDREACDINALAPLASQSNSILNPPATSVCAQ